ncbi:hypothetical protein SD77_0061 [Bacillus badius]|uniref:Uncharacterized protein n=1 Tax=Bacillus badius TaxID=1455 RepID=A0ABR5AZP8_BACBA|nr:hypothetical protein SD78_3387 [Bacillus badius]KIL80213.1 hypothetical protein SD77_0061 [Bacillus badius]
MLNVLLYSLAGRHFQTAWLVRPSIMFFVCAAHYVAGSRRENELAEGGIWGH